MIPTTKLIYTNEDWGYYSSAGLTAFLLSADLPNDILRWQHALLGYEVMG